MKTHREEDGSWVLSLERGDDIRSSLESWAQHNRIGCAQLSGIGAVEHVELGCYDLETKQYDRRTFEGIWELLSFEGNITLKDDAPFLHAHVTISGHDYQVWGGHLFDAKIGVAGELFARPLAKPLKRVMCVDIGLPRWEP